MKEIEKTTNALVKIKYEVFNIRSELWLHRCFYMCMQPQLVESTRVFDDSGNQTVRKECVRQKKMLNCKSVILNEEVKYRFALSLEFIMRQTRATRTILTTSLNTNYFSIPLVHLYMCVCHKRDLTIVTYMSHFHTYHKMILLANLCACAHACVCAYLCI